MHLEALRLGDFRNVGNAELAPGPGLNVIHGRNGAGKTSLLEAVYFLARGKSFRASQADRLVRNGQAACWVYGEGIRAGERLRLGIERRSRQMRLRRNGEDVRSLSEWAQALPVEVINSETQRFFLDGPAVRRSFLNWGVFHVEPGYRGHWQDFRRALMQCNAALRSGDTRGTKVWEQPLVEAAEAVDAARGRFVQALNDVFQPMADEWLPGMQLQLRYRRGWRSGESLAELMAEARGRALELGHVLQGPQRADLKLLVDAHEAQDRLSRGQQKMAAVALVLSKAALIARASETQPVLLLDDLPAELDAVHRELVLAAVTRDDIQTFLTCIEPETVEPPTDAKWFHVEQGTVTGVL